MWIQLQLEICQGHEVEALSEALELAGALSITLTDKNDDPVLEPAPGTTPLWPDVIITALFTDPVLAQHTRDALLAQYPHLQGTISTLPDQDWERAWMDAFKPQQFGKKLWVCPSWLSPSEPDAINLILDPGLAFGTGTHPTTALCLSWLGDADLSGLRVIDYGCGSGILALAALKLGAESVQAVDIDDQALTATHNNAEVNAVNLTQLQIGKPESLQGGVDLILANILLGPLLELKNRFRALLQADGKLVVSGLLEEQAATLKDAYQDVFSHQTTCIEEGWALVVLKPL